MKRKSNQTTNKPRILATMLLAMSLTGCAADSGALAPPSVAPSQSISSSGNDSPSEPSSNDYTEPAPKSSTLAPESTEDFLESGEADTTEADTTDPSSESETKETESKEKESKEKESKETKEKETKETDETETKESKETGTKEKETKESKEEQNETTKEADPAPEAKPSKDEVKPGTGTDKPDNAAKPTVTKVTATVSGSYFVGSTLSASAFKVTAYFSDGTVLTNPPGFTASPLTLTGESNVITVSYKGASTTVTVKAAKKEPPKTPETPQAPENKPENKPETKPETPPETPKAPEKTEATPVSISAKIVGGPYYHGDPITKDVVDVTVTMSDGSVLRNPDGITFGYNTFRAPGGGLDVTYKNVTSSIIVGIIDVCPDSDFSREVALEAFKLQNEMRAEAGSPPLTWSDDLYEVAKKCAKICGDNETIDHSLTTKFRMYTYIDAAGYEQEEGYAENLSLLGIGNAPQFIAKQSLDGIKNSPGHYETAMYNSGPNERCAIAAYRKGTTMYISYIFHHIDLDY